MKKHLPKKFRKTTKKAPVKPMKKVTSRKAAPKHRKTVKIAKSTKKAKVIALIATSIVVLIAITTLIVFAIKTNGFKDSKPSGNQPNGSSELQDFTLIYDDKVCNEIKLDSSDTIRIGVQDAGRFNVKIQPKKNVFFDFKLDGNLHAFTAESGDYNRAFNLVIKDDCFDISSISYNIEDVLNLAYFGHVVSDLDETANSYDSYFEIVVTAENGLQKTINVIGTGESLIIKVNPDEVVFK